MNNPFVTKGYAGPDYFCDRVKETEDLVKLLTNENNMALISPRRIGKTDLVHHCFCQLSFILCAKIRLSERNTKKSVFFFYFRAEVFSTDRSKVRLSER